MFERCLVSRRKSGASERYIDKANQMDIREQTQRYARASRVWFGDKAREVVLGNLEERRRVGDVAGLRLWEGVANELAHQSGRRTVRLS
jgi:hypothetical protein